MFLFNIIKFLFVFFIFFIVVGFVKFFLLVSKEVNRQVKTKDQSYVKREETDERDREAAPKSSSSGQVIELSEDQYKVE
jgi:hypothetical protein